MNDSKSDPPAAAQEAEQQGQGQQQGQRLNTRDIKKGLTYLVTRGSTRDTVSAADFEGLFEAKAKAMGWLGESERFNALRQSDIAQATSRKIQQLVDADGDGKVTANDFELLFNKKMEYLESHAAVIDRVLPVAGQAGFGIMAGFLVGTAVRSLYQYKFMIALTGLGLYSGLQYLAQEQFINQQQIQAAVQRRLHDALDANKDGELTREDIEVLLEKKMAIVNTKLGPGGFLPGAAGYTTFGMGMLWAVRRGARRF